jgi:GNAT superfamily N-acetyltransferase
MTTAIPQKTDEVSESLDQWVRFCSTSPKPSLEGEVIQEQGLTITCCRTLWPMGNMAIFTAPVESHADLTHRVGIGHEDLVARGCSGVFFVADHLVESLQSAVPDVFARYGYAPEIKVMGMAANALVPPQRPMPALQYQTVGDPSSRRTIAELNAIAYEVPLEWGADFDERCDVWNHGAFGVIGYLDKRPAACSVTVPLNGRLYVAFVATAREFRRMGCAEAVMRRCLDEAAGATGLVRTILHASPMGHPLYTQMGYHDTMPFTVYVHGKGE